MNAIRTALFAAITLTAASGASIRALIIDGADTRPQTPGIQAILEAADTHVDVLTAPGKGSPFEPPFDRYKVVVLNYGGDAWPLATIAALQKYVQNGGGLVALATADATFPEWTEYNLKI